MKKLLFLDKGIPAWATEPPPRCADDTILLRTLYSGLSNGTERNQMMAGNYNASGSFPFRSAGYQTVSEVIETGAKVTRFAVGDTVVTGTFGTHAQFHTAREGELVTKLPGDFDLPAAALTSVASVALHNIRRAEIGSTDKVMVCGTGLIGLFALQWCRLRGAATVVLARSERREGIAREMGAADFGSGDDAAQREFVRRHRPCTAAIETTGSPEVVDLIVGVNWGEGLFTPRSRPRLLAVAGNWRVAYSCNAAQASELAILHAVHFALEDQVETVEAIARGALKVRPLIQRIVPAADMVRTYELLRDEPGRLFGTVFDWTSLS